jgi:hypothetical protein
MALSLVKADENVDTLADVEVPAKYYNRLLTGVEAIDVLFGGDKMPGILPGSCAMGTGVPGAGKTTFMLQLADALEQNAGRRLLYNANEESKAMIKLAADRLGIVQQFQVSQKQEVDDLVRHVLQEGYEVLFQDSLQTLQDGQLYGQRLLKSVCRKLVRLSKDHEVTVVVVGQVTKSGVAAGPMALVHEVDVHLHLDVDPKSGNRTMVMKKNRFGPALMPYEFMLSARGLEFRPAPEDAAAADQAPASRQTERRQEVQALVEERLRSGEPLSGYCFERLGLDCSGGYWRGMLRLVVERMKREGMRVGERKVNGRLHYFLEGEERRDPLRRALRDVGLVNDDGVEPEDEP